MIFKQKPLPPDERRNIFCRTKWLDNIARRGQIAQAIVVRKQIINCLDRVTQCHVAQHPLSHDRRYESISGVHSVSINDVICHYVNVDAWYRWRHPQFDQRWYHFTLEADISGHVTALQSLPFLQITSAEGGSTVINRTNNPVFSHQSINQSFLDTDSNFWF